ncbi:MAG: hypothetical protein ACPHQT_09550 [Planctomycetota bacterium]
MESWIYLIIFVIVPIINRLIEMNKARAEKAAAETKRMMRKEMRKARKEKSSRQIQVDTDPVPPAVAKDQDWQTVEAPLPFAPDPSLEESTPELDEGGMWTPGGWVDIPDGQIDPRTGLPLPVGSEITGRESVPGLEIFALPEIEEVSPPEPAESPGNFNLESSKATTAYLRDDIVNGVVISASSRKRRRLSKAQLRDRLIWREILGPPLSMREAEI